MHAVLFSRYSHRFCILRVQAKFIWQIKSIVQADRLTWNHIPCLRQTNTKLIYPVEDREVKNHTLSIGTYTYGPCRGVPPSPRPGLFTLPRRVAKKPIRSVHDPLSKSARHSFAPESPFYVRCGFRAHERAIRYNVDRALMVITAVENCQCRSICYCRIGTS